MLWLLFGQRIGSGLTDGYYDTILKRTNLIPFATIIHHIDLLGSKYIELARHAAINLIGNVVMFIPLGFFLPSIWPKFRFYLKFMLAVFLTITSVELIQLVTLLGSMDIDDLILNLAGASIGFLIYIIITSVCNKRKKD